MRTLLKKQATREIHVFRKGNAKMQENFTYIADLAEKIEKIPDDSIVSRTLFSDDNIKGVLFGFAPGQELSEHTASTPALIHILSGQGRLTLGGENMAAKPGTWVHMQPNLAHSLVAETPMTMLLLLIR
jgi:quercetin dioxygenase-like cupin family protein